MAAGSPAIGAGDNALALLFKTHPAPGERLEELGNTLTPNLSRLPAGLELEIRRVAAGAGPMRAAQPLPAEGARGLAAQPQQPAQQPKSGGGIGIDPGQLLRGLFGR